MSRLTLFGFEHIAVDNALLEEDCNTGKLKISNLGSSGCDGVSIDLGDSDGAEVVFDEILAPASWPDGAVFRMTRDFGGNASHVWVSEDIGNQVEIRTSFNGFGVNSTTLRVWESDSSGTLTLKEEVTGHTGSWDFRIDDPNDPTARAIGYGTTSTECRGRFRCGSSGGGECRLITVNGGSTVLGNLLEVETENYTPVQGSSTLTFQAGAGISELTVADEALHQFPELPHRVIDAAVFVSPPSRSRLKISNLGSSGCDGVSIDLGESDSFEMVLHELNDGNPIPDGSFTETQVWGRLAGVPDQLITTSRITDAGTQLELSVTTPPPGASYTVRLFNGGASVFDESGRGGSPVVRVAESNPCKSEEHFVLPNLDGIDFPFTGTENYLTVWRWDTPAMIEIPGGATIQADELHVVPEGVAAPDFMSQFELRGADVGAIEIGGEDSFLCRGGSVNWGIQAVAEDVLHVNNSAGSPGLREVVVGVRESITVSLRASPSGPAQAKYFLCAWIGGPQVPTNLSVQGSVVGCFVNPIPLTGGGPQPFRCLRGGLPSSVCSGVRELTAPSRAPFAASKANGLANPLSLTIQAFLQDAGSSHPIDYSVTNAVVLRVQ